MKHNHRRNFVAKTENDRMYDRRGHTYYLRKSRKRNQQGMSKSTYSDKVFQAGPGFCSSGKMLQRGRHGAKHFLRSRVRFHDKMKLKKDMSYIDIKGEVIKAVDAEQAAEYLADLEEFNKLKTKLGK